MPAPRADADSARHAPVWLDVRVTPRRAGDSPERARIAAALVAHGSGGVIEEEGSTLRGFVPIETDESALRAALREADPDADTAIARAAPIDWSERWRDAVRAHVVGPLTVAPPWLAAASDPAWTVVIDPGMAFGTGEHPTTRGAIRLASRVVRGGDSVADLGAGSGVLAIAAAKLGAARVAAIELDADAIGNAEANIARNGVADRVHVIDGDAALLLPLLAPVRVVLANIISSTIVDLLPAIGAALTSDGRAILSGILVEERPGMVARLTGGGWRVADEELEDAWWSVTIARH